MTSCSAGAGSPREADFRRAEPGELAAVATLAARVLPEAGGEASLRSLLSRPAAELWVAADAGSLQGFLVALRVDTELEILWLGVAPADRRRRLGSQLLAAATAGCSACHLEVRANHREAQAFYRRSGFVEAGRRHGYYPEGEDALLLRWSPEGDPQG